MICDIVLFSRSLPQFLIDLDDRRDTISSSDSLDGFSFRDVCKLWIVEKLGFNHGDEFLWQRMVRSTSVDGDRSIAGD